jgi:hypothetical protein
LIKANIKTKALAFAGLGFLLQFGLVLGITTGDSLFLAHVGPPGLPTVYILQTFVMLAYTAAFVTLVKRFGIDRIFDGALVLMAIAGIAIWTAFRHVAPAPFYYAVKLYAGMWYFGLYTLFWTFLDSWFDLTDAKKLYSLFAAGGAAGAMASGALVSLFAGTIGPGSFFLLWAAIALATWPALVGIRRTWPKIDVNDDDAAPEGSAFAEAYAGVKSLGQSRYAMALTVGFFLIAVAATVCDYQYMRVFSAGRDEAALATLFGRMTLIANLANMLITLFLFNPLVARFGVRNIALLQPVIFGAVFLWFAGAPGMGAAVAGFLAYHALMMAIDINNGNLLVFGLPAARRKELRTFIEGICLPAAAASAGLFLLIVAPGLSLQQVALIGIGFAVLTLGFNLIVRRDYVGAIAANLRAGWLDLSVLPPRGRGDLIQVATTGVDAIAPLLRKAGDYSASERHLVEHLIVAMGPSAIPTLVEVSESAHYTLRGRSIALRALGKLDFPRLQAVASPLMLRTARRAFEFLGRYDALQRAGADDAGSVVLRRINQDYPMLTLEVVLEALTIAGRLPPYEAIVVALNGGPSRERGFAVETVEQGAGRALEQLLAPWIADWPPERQLAHARELDLLAAMSETEALERALASAFPLEAAAAGQAFRERGEPHRLAQKLHDLPHPILIETARILAERAAGELTPIECVAAVMRVPDLAFFKFTHLEWLAPSLRAEAIAAGQILAQRGGPIDRAWVVIEGSMLVDGQAFGAGSVAGKTALTGDRISHDHIVAGDGLRFMALPASLVLSCSEVFSELGIELLRLRLMVP